MLGWVSPGFAWQGRNAAERVGAGIPGYPRLDGGLGRAKTRGASIESGMDTAPFPPMPAEAPPVLDDADLWAACLTQRFVVGGPRLPSNTAGALQLVVHGGEGKRYRWVEIGSDGPRWGEGLADDVRSFVDVDAADLAALVAGRPLAGKLRVSGDTALAELLLKTLAAQPRAGSPLSTRLRR